MTLIERLRKLSAEIDPMLMGGPDARLLNEAARAIEAAEAMADAYHEHEFQEALAKFREAMK